MEYPNKTNCNHVRKSNGTCTGICFTEMHDDIMSALIRKRETSKVTTLLSMKFSGMHDIIIKTLFFYSFDHYNKT